MKTNAYDIKKYGWNVKNYGMLTEFIYFGLVIKL